MLEERLRDFFNFYKKEKNIEKELDGLDVFIREYRKRNSKLCNLLGDRLVYKFPVSIELNLDEVASIIDKDKTYTKLYLDISEKLKNFFNKNNLKYTEVEKNQVFYFFNTPKYYATNIYSGSDFEFEGVKIKKGCKTLKHAQIILNKIIYNKEKIDEFVNYMSTFRNQYKIEGKLCISIDPIDFLTESTNKCGWSSCYDAFNPAGYNAAATLEYLFNEHCVIAYLESKKPMYLGDLECSNKRWREFFYIDENVITNIKGYPYQNDKLTLVVLGKLHELAIANWGYNFYSSKPLLFEKGKNPETDYQIVPFFPEEIFTYENDYNERPHWAYFIEQDEDDFFSIYDVYILDFTRHIICPFCGKTETVFTSASLSCASCDNNIVCEYCGYLTKEDEIYEVVDKTTGKKKKICKDCLYDDSCDSGYLLDVYLDRPVEKEKVKYIEIAADDEYKLFLGVQLSKESYPFVFKPGTELKQDDIGGHYVYSDELTPEGIKAVFKEHGKLIDLPTCDYDFLPYSYITIGSDKYFVKVHQKFLTSFEKEKEK